jgi:protein arginine kinase
MSNLRFTEKALSDWMRSDAADSEIVISSRVRIARNLQHYPFPMLASNEQSEEVLNKLSEVLQYPGSD